MHLRAVNVVVTARSHNPSILNPDFLKIRGIVPDNWQVSETITSPAASVVRYTNGVNWEMDQSRLQVSEIVGPEFKDVYNIHQPVKSYLNTLPHCPYQNLGLNFQIAIPKPQVDLLEQFGASWMSNEDWILEMIPAFRLKTEDGLSCRITVLGLPLSMGELGLDCNFHHETLSNSGEFCDAITEWPARQKFVISAVTKLFAR